MENLIGKLVAGILRQENAPPESYNPGNIRNPKWIEAPDMHNGYWVPESRAEGLAGVFHIVALRIAEGYSLSHLISSYAPPSDRNPTAQYTANVARWAGIADINIPLMQLLEPSTPTPAP